MTFVCNQLPAGQFPFCHYCTGIYSAIALSFPVFLFLWRKPLRLKLSIVIVCAVPLLALMCAEFWLHYRGVWSLPSGARVVVGAGNGIAFGAISAFFWNYFFGGRIPMKAVYPAYCIVAAGCFAVSQSPAESVLLAGVFLRFFLANTLVIAALAGKNCARVHIPMAAGLGLSCLEWWVFYAFA